MTTEKDNPIQIDLNQFSRSDKYDITINSKPSINKVRQIRDIIFVVILLLFLGTFCWMFCVKITDKSTSEIELRWIQSTFFAILGWIVGYVTNRDFGK